MKRLKTYTTSGSTGTFNWVCPAGVTTVYFSGIYFSTYGQSMIPITVVPNTTYAIVINSNDTLADATTYPSSTFGSLFSFKQCRTVYLTWVE